MIFNSVTYLLFLTLTVALCWLLPYKPRVWLILIASALFYAFWRPEFLLVMLLSTTVDYVAALHMDETDSSLKRNLWLATSLTVNLGLLCYFKYLFFFVDNAVAAMHFFGMNVKMPVLNIMLPLGISFYTFETISYVVDVYRKLIKPERSWVMYGCFVTFFPKLIAGPVLRAREMLPQFAFKPIFRLPLFVSGLKRILFGLFLKVVLADNLAPLVDAGFAQKVSSLSAIDVLTLAFLFGFQIYFDFSAYSSIAIGSARLMGMHIPENFNFPYIARTPKEFWKRWHISLSSWIRDYLYLPLLGVKVQDRSVGGIGSAIDVAERNQSVRHPLFALLMTWAIMGFWHGANWTFMIWGLCHAILITVHRLLSPVTHKLPIVFREWGGWLFTLPCVMLAWIPFRAQSVHDAVSMFGKLLSPGEYLWLGMRENTYLITALICLSFFATYGVYRYVRDFLEKRVPLFILEVIPASVASAFVFIFFRPINQFIYFQF